MRKFFVGTSLCKATQSDYRNTGKSTGPHLHYEVHIGSDVVDPAKYVNVVLTK